MVPMVYSIDMKRQRLSIALLWKLLVKYQELGEEYDNATITDFVVFVESEMKKQPQEN